MILRAFDDSFCALYSYRAADVFRFKKARCGVTVKENL